MTASFDLQHSRAILAVRRQRQVTSPPWVLVRWLIRVVTSASLAATLVGLLTDLHVAPALVGLLLIVSGVGLTLLIADLFAQSAWSSPPEGASDNVADNLTREAAVLCDALIAANRGSVPATITLAGLLVSARGTQAGFVLQRLGLIISPEDAAVLANQEAGTGEKTTEMVIVEAMERAKVDGRQQLDDIDLVSVVLRDDQHAAKLLQALQVTDHEVMAAAVWLRRLRARAAQKPFWQEPPGAGIAQDWTSGYTPFLQNFAPDLTKTAAAIGQGFELFGRAAELTQLEQTLAKSQGHNVLLVGAPGIGKDSLILGLAQRVAHGATVPALRYQHLLRLDVSTVLAGVSDRGEIEARLVRIFSEAARAGNTILVIPDIHLLVGGGERVAGVDATELLIQMLQSPSVRIIATTTPEEFQSRLSAQISLVGLLERLDLADLPADALLSILEDAVMLAEAENGVFFTLPALRAIVDIATRYAKDTPAPVSALNLLADVVSATSGGTLSVITPDVVRAILSKKLDVPLDTAQGEERAQLVHLEEHLHETVVDQEEAIGAVADALRRARAGLASGARPIASLLFLGPTGVGKTETAKALARVYFGANKTDEKMIRFDMSEYSQPDSLARLIGAPGVSGVKTGGLLADAIHDHPFSLLLLDEFEKAHPQILNVFLQIIDDGRLTDGTGRVIDFTNTLIIATSNAGAELIRESIAAGEDQATRRAKLLDNLQSTGVYKPELLNRFDGVIAFRPLAPEHVRAIVQMMLAALAAKLLAEQQITLVIGNDLVDALAAAGFDPQFGARPIRRLIQDKVESWLANQLLIGAIAKGESVQVTTEAIGLTLRLETK